MSLWLILVSLGFWTSVAFAAVAVYLASNLAGTAGSGMLLLPTADAVAIAGVIDGVGLFQFRRKGS